MRRLAEGTIVFKNKVFEPHRDYFQPLSQAQQPTALMFTCCDSRVEPVVITQCVPGTLFVVRNIGNLVPKYQEGAAHGEAAAIEFALNILNVHHIIVCGHTDCAAMKSLLRLEALDPDSSAYQWLAPNRELLKALDPNQDEEVLLNELIRRNVIQQLQNLVSYPQVARRLAQRQLHLYGWKYRLETGETVLIDPFSCHPKPLSAIIGHLQEEPRPEISLSQIEREAISEAGSAWSDCSEMSGTALSEVY